MEKAIAWDRIEAILMKDYPVGQKKEGDRVYNPLLLFKCLLLQKWFRISSDPELEDSINDRDSFQTFLGLSSVESSPDHSTFSKFRKRLTKGKCLETLQPQRLQRLQTPGSAAARDNKMLKMADAIFKPILYTRSQKMYCKHYSCARKKGKKFKNDRYGSTSPGF
jgi:transposase, IS5 family